MIVEIVQAHPYAFTTGYYSGRIWVNGTGMNRAYFGDFTTGHLFYDMNTDQLQLCSQTLSGTNNITAEGNYDMMNFIWFKGSEGLYVPIGGKFCSSYIFIDSIIIRPNVYAQGIHQFSSDNMSPM